MTMETILNYTEARNSIDVAMDPVFAARPNNYAYAYGNLVAWMADALLAMPAKKRKEFVDSMIRLNSQLPKS